MLDMQIHATKIDVDSTPHASPAHDSDADQAGSCLFFHEDTALAASVTKAQNAFSRLNANTHFIDLFSEL